MICYTIEQNQYFAIDTTWTSLNRRDFGDPNTQKRHALQHLPGLLKVYTTTTVTLKSTWVLENLELSLNWTHL